MRADDQDLPWPRRLSRWLEAAWASGVATRPSLNPGRIIAAARARGDGDPADGPWRERLHVLCDALRHEAILSSLGRTIAHGQLVRIVAARARGEALWRRHPQIAERSLAKPLVLVGQMRSGTTRLHRLLACDPDFAATRLFETLEPIPHRGPRWLPDRRPAAAWAAQALLERCNPSIRRIHPSAPFAVEEDFGLHAYSLWGAQFEGQWYVPGFARFCEGQDPADVYGEFAQLLRTIGWARGQPETQRWLLKAPQFCQDLATLLRQFPDAQLVTLRRDPADVVGSGASLAWHHARVQSEAADRSKIGAEWMRKTVLREERMARDLAASQADRFDVDYDAMSRDWRGTIRRLYDYLEKPLPPSVEARMARLVERSTAHRGHRYRLEDFGLEPAAVAAKLR